MEEGIKRASASATRQTRRMERDVRHAVDSLDIFGGPLARMMDQNLVTLQKMLHVTQHESLNFMNRRLKHTGEAIGNSRERQGVSALLQIQQEWMLGLARDCAEQAKRFAELMREIAEEGTSHLSQASAELIKTAEEEHRAAA